MSAQQEMTNTETDLEPIREQIRRVLTEHNEPLARRKLLDTPGSFDTALWQQAVNLGWPLLAAGESHGGLDLGLPALSMVMEELGYHAVSLPLAPAFVLQEVLSDASLAESERHATLKAISSGEQIVCVALAEPGNGVLPAAPAVTLSNGLLSGAKSLTPYAAVADVALVLVTKKDGAQSDTVLALVDLSQASVTRKCPASVDNARAAAELNFDNAVAMLIDAPVEPTLTLSALIASYEQLGGAEAAMLMARDYALERTSFGQPIGRFQAIKHKIADMYTRIQLARGCASDAVAAYVAGSQNWLQLSAAARLGACEAFDFTAAECVQTLGGLGTSWEADAHIYYRRAKALTLELGASHYWRDRVIGRHGFRNGSCDSTAEVKVEALDASEELRNYRLQARAWLADNAPEFSGAVREGLSFEQDLTLGRQWQTRKSEAGYAAINLPRALGGGGKTELHKIVFGEEELRYQVPIEYFVISTSQCMAILLNHGSPEAVQKLAPLAVRGEQIWCQMFSEPQAGSDLAALRLKAVREERDGVSGWCLNGQKLWTSWAHVADWGFVLTRTDPSQLKHAGLTAFYLDMQSPGLTVNPIRRMVGHADVCEVFFDDVFVPDAQRFGPEGRGFYVAMEMLMVERIAGVYDESMGGVSLDQVVRLAKEARFNGESALDDGQVRQVLAQAFMERQGLRAIYRKAMQDIEQGAEPGPEGGIRKLVLGRMRQKLSALAMELTGPQGLMLADNGDFRSDVAWSWLDPAARIAGGTDEVLLSTLAERVLGLPQDYRPDKNLPFNELS